MKKLSIAKIIDQYGWSYFFIAKEMALYSKNEVFYQKYNDYNYSKSDIILISSPNISGNISNIQIPQKAKALRKIVIGQYSGETNQIYKNVDLIITISPFLYWSAKAIYKDIPVIFLPEAIDDKYFSYSKKIPNNPIVVGWAGGSNKIIKRHQLLDELKNCQIIKQMNHGSQYFTENRTLDEMREFYSKIDIFVLPSLTECMPRVLMEAMACGKTCFATDVGSNSILLFSENLLTVYPDSKVLRELQYVIDNVKYNGEENRKRVEQYFSWSIVMPIWDKVFEALINKDYTTIENINMQFINQWESQFLNAKTKIEHAKSLGYNYVHETYKLDTTQ
jgi:glycosyltransferase involved in cell wall biosynthesis